MDIRLIFVDDILAHEAGPWMSYNAIVDAARAANTVAYYIIDDLNRLLFVAEAAKALLEAGPSILEHSLVQKAIAQIEWAEENGLFRPSPWGPIEAWGNVLQAIEWAREEGA